MIRKTYEEVTKKFESIYWPDGKPVIGHNKWREAEKEFEVFLRESGWTHDFWLDELCRRVVITSS